MTLNLAIAVMVISLFGVAPSAQANESIRDIDFNKFTYSIRSGGIGPSGEICLSQGEYRDGYSGGRLGNVQYADLNGDEIEDALVTLAASGGGSGVSTHAFGFTLTNGTPDKILYRMNFLDINAQWHGFTLITSSPPSTGHQQCSGFLVRSNALDIGTYQWNGSDFVLTHSATVMGQEVCNYF